jgi:hypothetical protein
VHAFRILKPGIVTIDVGAGFIEVVAIMTSTYTLMVPTPLLSGNSLLVFYVIFPNDINIANYLSISGSILIFTISPIDALMNA